MKNGVCCGEKVHTFPLLFTQKSLLTYRNYSSLEKKKKKKKSLLLLHKLYLGLWLNVYLNVSLLSDNTQA